MITRWRPGRAARPADRWLAREKELDVLSILAVIAYPDQNAVAEAAAALPRMQKEFVIELGDVAWSPSRRTVG